MYLKFIFILKSIVKSFINPNYYLRIISNDIKSFLNIYNYKNKNIFVIGLPKSGTTLVENFLSNLPGYSPRILLGHQKNLREGKLSLYSFDMLFRFQHSFFKTHIIPTEYNINCLLKNNIKKVVFMYRDPRDIVVSLYYFQKKKNYIRPNEKFFFDPKLTSKEKCFDFLIKYYIPANIKWIENWQSLFKKNQKLLEVLFVRYEDLIIDKNKQFQKIINFYDINLDAKFFSGVNTKKKLFNIFTLELPGQKNTFRTGTKNNWVNEFNENQKNYVIKSYGEFFKKYNYIK